MATKDRYQNPQISDEVVLKLFTYNGNVLSDLYEIEKVEIFFLDPDLVTAENPEGLRLVDTFDSSAVTHIGDGAYSLNVEVESAKYTIGKYYDIWTVKSLEDYPANELRQTFQIYPSLWYSTPIPAVYDFNFLFKPNKFRKGSKQYIIIEIIPNVPTAGDLRAYYENLAIASDVRVSIEQVCGDCMPTEQDLRLIVDNELTDYREKRFAFYQLDTEELDCGLYDIWFRMEFGDNIYLSDREKIQIYN